MVLNSLATNPGKPGLYEIQTGTPSLPVIVLTGKTEVNDKVLLLKLGADDYVTKPFSPQEGLARVRAAIRRTDRDDRRFIRLRRYLGGLRPNGTYASWQKVSMVAKEFKLLKFFAQSCRPCLFAG